jgi:hypothetical protein
MSNTAQPTDATVEKPTTELPDDQIAAIFAGIADGFRSALRSPIMHTPDEVGLAFEDITFLALDGVPLEGWFIPCAGSDKIIIANHPQWFSRSGLPSHLEPWKSLGGYAGNDFEVNLVPDYKILHDAGYNVLAYDTRNYGRSSSANGGIISVGNFESRDVVGSLRYVREREDTKDMIIGLFSRCNGANGTMKAMELYPGEFAGVRAMVAPQPLSLRATLEATLSIMGIPAAQIDNLEEQVRLRNGFKFDEMSPVPWAKSVTVPTFIYQVRDDLMTNPSDVQAVYDNIPIDDKKLFWIEGTTRRWDGYLYFQQEPAQMLDWFATHMS